MILRLIPFSVKAMAAFAALAAIGLASGAGQAGSSGAAAAASGPVRCEIEATAAGGMVTLRGVVHADRPVRGTFSFRVAGAGGGGRSNVSQGGEFSAGPDAAALGQVILGGKASYDARLEVDVGGQAVECTKRGGGTIL